MVAGAITGGLIEKAGLELVVEGIEFFAKNMKTANKLIGNFGDTATSAAKGGTSLLSKAFSALGDSIQRIFEITAGVLIRDAINGIIGGLRDMASAALDAAMNFQQLLLRLETFVARDLRLEDSALGLADSFEMAVEPAKELFVWVQKLAIATPFDTEDVADVLSMAKAYGFATEEAKALAVLLADFSAGMGLSEDAMKRVIIALGQMNQKGRVTGEELRQLGNAMVPVADVLEMTRLKIGATKDGFEELRKKGLIPIEPFMESFNELIGRDFVGAADKANKSLRNSISNLKDLFVGLLGFDLIRPILDSIGGRIASVLDAFEGERFNRLKESLGAIGKSFAGMLDLFFLKALPSGDTIADFIVEKVGKLAVKVAGAFGDLMAGITQGETPLHILFDMLNNFVAEDTLGVIFDGFVGLFQIIKSLFSGDFVGGQGFGFQEDHPIINFIFDIREAIVSFKEALIQVHSILTKGVFTVSDFGGLASDNPLIQFLFSVRRAFRDLDISELVTNFLAEINHLFELLTRGDMQQDIFGPDDPDGKTPLENFMLNIHDSLDSLRVFWEKHGDRIMEIFRELFGAIFGVTIEGGETALDVIGDIIASFTDSLAGEGGEKFVESLGKFSKFIQEDVIPSIRWIFDFAREHSTEIGIVLSVIKVINLLAPAILNLGLAAIAVMGAGAILGDIAIGIGALIGVMGTGGAAINMLLLAIGPGGWLILGIGTLIALIATIGPEAFVAAQQLIELLAILGSHAMRSLWEGMGAFFNEVLLPGVRSLFTVVLPDRIRAWIRSIWDFGRQAMEGFWISFGRYFNEVFLPGVLASFNFAKQWIKNLLGIASPSKVFMEMGEQVVAGFAEGILRATTLAKDAATIMASQTIQATATLLPAQAQTGNTTNNFNLTVNSSARTEPIIDDYNMMKSLSEV